MNRPIFSGNDLRFGRSLGGYLLRGLLLSQSFGVFAGERFEISEASLLKLSRSDESLNKIGRDLKVTQSQLGLSSREDPYSWTLFGQVNRQASRRTDPRATAGFYDPREDLEIGVSKQTSVGVNTKVSLFGENVTTADRRIVDASNAGARLGLDIDLWKNLFGRRDRAELKSLGYANEVAKLENKMGEGQFEFSLRKLYWAMVANNASQLLANELLSAAKDQYKEAQRRQKASVAGGSEVARYGAQMASRQSTLRGLSYQAQTLQMQMKGLVQALGGKDLVLAPYSVKDAVAKTLECAAVISNQKSTPWQNTYIDEIIAVQEKIYKEKKLVAESANDANLSLFGELDVAGTGDTISKAGFDNFPDDPRVSYKIGLKISKKIGDAPSSNQRLRERIEAEQSQLRIQELKSQIETAHEQMPGILSELNAATEALSENGDLLEEAVKASKQEYSQARISVDILIADQNALLATKLDQIKTRLSAIAEVFDYLTLFPGTPCQLNHMVQISQNQKGIKR